MWRVSFAATSIAGAIALVGLFVYGRRRFGIIEIGHILSFFLFVVVAVVAISPSVVANVGLRVAPLRVEATLLSLLVFTGWHGSCFSSRFLRKRAPVHVADES